ncbi:MAG: amidohydrolase [Balneola sp.]|jgi:imidazolonepropionase-like amidohydrolase|nr:amidohydrolase [Balneola sp.]MBE78705.1 amidohydrolase [Balneola sp.]HBX67115.1 amidohydrolase [Balneolaceae bacterium]|tara:strand:- start:577 stop:1983 length:1407 start_codon:yes stop_codon:yes gene_type:complete
MRITNYLFLSLILFFSACSNSANPDQYLITGVNVIDIETGNISENQSILINKNEIADIFEDGAKSPDVFETIAMEGKYVIPGLWDMHIHLRGGQELVPSNRSLLPMYLASGVTSVRDAGGDLTPSIFDWQSQIEAGSLEGPDIYTSGPKIDGPDPTWEGSIEVVNSEEISAALDSLESIGVDYVKIYESTLSGEAYLEIIRQAEERGLTVTGHMPMSIFIDDAISEGLDGIEHLYYVLKGTSDRELEITSDVYNGRLGFWSAVAELKESYNEDTARVFYQRLVEEEVYVIPTLHIDNILSFLHEVDHTDDEYLKYIPEDIQETYQRRVRSAQRRDAEAIQFEKELNDLFKKITGDMQAAGIKILAGSDAGAYNSYVYPGISLHKELQEFVSSGLTPLEALQASSLNGSLFFGDYDQTGSINIGKQADLLILNANPLSDIKNTEQIYSVVSNGKHYDKGELEKILEEMD